MSQPLKVGVIGVGGIARTHYPGWKSSPDAELVALADINAEILNKVADDHEVERRYDKIEDLLADKDIDIIDVCTPSSYHAPLSIAALEAGKHVICEKPLAPTPDEIRKMIATRDKSGKLLMTAQHFRFKGNTNALKDEIDSGALGDIYHARSWLLRRSGVPARESFLMKKHAGGGPCIDIGVHILDLTLWMMGNPKPDTVSGVTQDRLSKQPGAFSSWSRKEIPPVMDVEEFASGFVRFKNGATLNLEVSWLLHHGAGEDMQMWLYGDRGGAHYPSNQLFSSNNETKQLLTTKLELGADKMKPHALECMAFAEAIANGKPSPVPAEQSLDVQVILDGLYQSAAQGREISLD